MTLWIPKTVSDLSDYFSWMIGKLSDARDPYGRQLSLDELFSNGYAAIRDMADILGKDLEVVLLKSLEDVKIFGSRGDIVKAKHLLQDMNKIIRDLIENEAGNGKLIL